MNKIELGKRIKLEIKKKGLTQAQLADTVDMQVSQLNAYLNGKYKMGYDMLLDICKALDISIDYLLDHKVGSYSIVQDESTPYGKDLEKEITELKEKIITLQDIVIKSYK